MDNDRILHSLGVANKMVEIGTKKGLSPKDLEDLFTLGINHDIGYKFGESSNHQIKGGLILKRNGYKYWQEVYYHGLIQNEYSSFFLDILNQADMQIDKYGQDIGYNGRLEDIKSRYGENSKVYKTCVELVNFIKKNATEDKVLEEKKSPRKHAIIVIKNKEGKYLQYYEPNWQSYLFLNCKVTSKLDTFKVKETVNNILGVEPQEISYKFNKIHKKYSVKDRINKEYQHFFYEVTLKENSVIQDDTFTINNINFKWFSLKELESDKRIQEVNGDIINFIKENNL